MKKSKRKIEMLYDHTITDEEIVKTQAVLNQKVLTAKNRKDTDAIVKFIENWLKG